MDNNHNGKMRRKVIKQGHNTLTITLPTEWAKRFNLGAGSEVDILERDNGLFITTEKNGHSRKAEIDITGMDNPTIWKYFMAVYREGYDEVVVKFDPNLKLDHPYKFYTRYRSDLKYGRESEKENPVEFLQDLVNRFIGFEIISYDKNSVIIKEISEATSKEFDNSFRRVFLLLQEMIDDTCESLKTENPKLLRHIHEVDINLDKFHDYCIRILNKIGNKDARKTSLLFSTLYLIELLGDEFKNIAIHLFEDTVKGINFKNLLQMAEQRREQLTLFFDCFYHFDIEKIKKIMDLDKKEFLTAKDKYKHTKSEEEKELLHHFRLMNKYINALTELRIEMEF